MQELWHTKYDIVPGKLISAFKTFEMANLYNSGFNELKTHSSCRKSHSPFVVHTYCIIVLQPLSFIIVS